MPERFADVLRRAIDARGLSLERIIDHLAHRGVSVSAATLSYWQSGRSAPGRQSSLTALPSLEEVLGLTRSPTRSPAPASVRRATPYGVSRRCGRSNRTRPCSPGSTPAGTPS